MMTIVLLVLLVAACSAAPNPAAVAQQSQENELDTAGAANPAPSQVSALNPLSNYVYANWPFDNVASPSTYNYGYQYALPNAGYVRQDRTGSAFSYALGSNPAATYAANPLAQYPYSQSPYVAPYVNPYAAAAPYVASPYAAAAPYTTAALTTYQAALQQQAIQQAALQAAALQQAQLQQTAVQQAALQQAALQQAAVYNYPYSGLSPYSAYNYAAPAVAVRPQGK